MRRACGVAPSTGADPVIPVADGGAHHIDNGQGWCEPCHGAKTRRENGVRNRRRSRRG
ncbi:HNH endonuclease [Pimelobacter simplex]|uniref:HNH endonuclease n=1 Tax=Nocardioides simplex TaxID=2045 RepID=UPI00345CCED7